MLEAAVWGVGVVVGVADAGIGDVGGGGLRCVRRVRRHVDGRCGSWRGGSDGVGNKTEAVVRGEKQERRVVGLDQPAEEKEKKSRLGRGRSWGKGGEGEGEREREKKAGRAGRWPS